MTLACSFASNKLFLKDFEGYCLRGSMEFRRRERSSRLQSCSRGIAGINLPPKACRPFISDDGIVNAEHVPALIPRLIDEGDLEGVFHKRALNNDGLAEGKP
jgi:hypothetical protein